MPTAVPATVATRRREPEVPNRRRDILLAAERLFAQRGYHAVSLRDIAAEAGVQVALVGYYYGAKRELYHAIFESWVPSIEQRRARLDEVMRAGPKATNALEGVLDAFIGPLVALHADPAGQCFARMAARDLAAPTPESEQAQHEFFDPMAHAFIDALHRLFPKRSRADVAWGYQFMLGAVLHFLSDVRIERLSLGTAVAADPTRKDMLQAFVAAGLSGVLGATPAAPRTPRTSSSRRKARTP